MTSSGERSPGTLEAGQAAAKHLAAEWQIDAEPLVLDVEPTAAETALPFREPARTLRIAEPPANPEQIVEAALFVGGPPLTAEKFQSAVRVPVEVFHDAVDALNRRYKSQRRPYSIQPKDGGHVVALRPQFHSLREKLFGGPREARLSQAALDVLSLVAYRQPIDKPEIDALR